MKAAIIGLPKTGKTTIFNALTRSEQSTDKYATPAREANIGVVQVADERIDKLAELYQPKKTIYATIEFHDYPGIFYKDSETIGNSYACGYKKCRSVYPGITLFQ
jgi:ribosome-binding ATPase YchF (GTP1/OBG family)